VVISGGPFIINFNKFRSFAYKITLEVSSTQLLSGLLSEHYLLRIHVGQMIQCDLVVIKEMMLSTILSLEFIVLICVYINATFGTKIARFLALIHH
jgi:hypothetical protein